MSPDDEALLQDLACGDRSLDDPEVRARLDADPALLAEVQALERARQQLAMLGPGDGSSELVEHAASAAERRAVGASLLPRLRRRIAPLAWLAVAAALLVTAVFWRPQSTSASPVDGPLGDSSVVSLLRDELGMRVHVRGALPPGTSFHLRLELADGTVWTDSSESSTWHFPSQWLAAAARPGPHRLVVEASDVGGLLFRRVHELP